MIVRLIKIIWSFKEIWILHLKASGKKKKKKKKKSENICEDFSSKKRSGEIIMESHIVLCIESVRWSY